MDAPGEPATNQDVSKAHGCLPGTPRSEGAELFQPTPKELLQAKRLFSSFLGVFFTSLKANFLQQRWVLPRSSRLFQPFVLLLQEAIPASILSSGGSCGKPAGMSRRRFESAVSSHAAAKPARRRGRQLLPGSKGPVWAPFYFTFHQPFAQL